MSVEKTFVDTYNLLFFCEDSSFHASSTSGSNAAGNQAEVFTISCEDSSFHASSTSGSNAAGNQAEVFTISCEDSSFHASSTSGSNAAGNQAEVFTISCEDSSFHASSTSGSNAAGNQAEVFTISCEDSSFHASSTSGSNAAGNQAEVFTISCEDSSFHASSTSGSNAAGNQAEVFTISCEDSSFHASSTSGSNAAGNQAEVFTISCEDSSFHASSTSGSNAAGNQAEVFTISCEDSSFHASSTSGSNAAGNQAESDSYLLSKHQKPLPLPPPLLKENPRNRKGNKIRSLLWSCDQNPYWRIGFTLKRPVTKGVPCGDAIRANLGKTGDDLLDGFLDCFAEVAVALSGRMSYYSVPNLVVDTTSRLAQWRINDLSSACTCLKSDPFKLGPWNWNLFLEKNRVLYVKLFPEPSAFTRASPPVASFVIRIVSLDGGNRKILAHPQVTDKEIKCRDDFVWAVDVPLRGRLIIDVEFLDLKARTVMQGDEPCSIWAEGPAQKTSNDTSLSTLGRMLKEGIHTDIVVNASDGSIGAHRAVLASRSAVFRSMFSYDLKEKELSAIDISDMSIEACEVFLKYIYGNIQHGDFLTHRLSLLRAADKYDIPELKEACHESLLEDIDTTNVLGRLQYAWLFSLDKLQSRCMLYLVKFGKIFDIRDDFTSFMKSADRELVAEVFNEVLSVWRGS
ncbi:hypothetical protein MLD38_035082 [Melastoma candidum]|uniref:Uncharacterized protein n=1 Tax=Melastoma candidum TaxID=119954 RepID=A0ACB9MBM1_9MYRT|nr:hypothetical protein MLD38_035082 [Melastoma candidum]